MLLVAQLVRAFACEANGYGFESHLATHKENKMNIKDYLECPKCRIKRLRKSVERNPKFGKEYFCDRCHVYFGVHELVHEWGWDAADFISGDLIYPELLIWERIKMAVDCGPKIPHPIDNGLRAFTNLEWLENSGQYEDGEWSSKIARDEAYEVVGRMFAGIPELEDGCGNDYDLYEFATGR